MTSLDSALAQLRAFEAALAGLAEAVRALCAQLAPPAGPDAQPLSHLDRAQVLLKLAQAMHDLHQMHMRARGLDPGKAPAVHAEGERLAAYGKKVAKAVAAHELSTSRPSVSLNVGAANRYACVWGGGGGSTRAACMGARTNATSMARAHACVRACVDACHNAHHAGG